MPDKDVMIQIRALEESRAYGMIDEYQARLLAALDIMPGEHAEADAMRGALLWLAENFRATADKYAAAKLKGAQTAHVVPLRHAAQQLDVVIKQLEQPRRAPLGQLQPGAGEPREIATPAAPAPDARPALDALVADAVAEGRGSVDTTPPSAAATWDAPGADPMADIIATADDAVAAYRRGATRIVTVPLDTTPEGEALGLTDADRSDLAKMAGALRDYLSGASNVRPVSAPPSAQVGAHDQTTREEGRDVFDGILDPQRPQSPYAPEADNVTTPPTPAPSAPAAPPVPLLGQPGDAGTGYAPTYIPPGGEVVTFAELLQPVPLAALPAHLSHSQIGTAGECPAKYRLTRLPRSISIRQGVEVVDMVTEIPEWANIGGSAFHAAVQDIENAMIAGATLPPSEPNFAERAFAAAFDAEITKVEASTPVPRARWRAAKQGSEHEAWWRVNGPQMLERYLAARPAEPTAKIPGAAQADAIEIELMAVVSTAYGPIPYKAIIDRVTVRESVIPGSDTPPWITLVIRDYKTGARMPDDASQLGEYANMLRLLGVPPQVKIVGTFFNARKGEWTREVDLSEAYTPEWFTYLVTTGHAQRLALTTGPTPARPSSFCGGCPVRWACPIKGVGSKR